MQSFFELMAAVQPFLGNEAVASANPGAISQNGATSATVLEAGTSQTPGGDPFLIPLEDIEAAQVAQNRNVLQSGLIFPLLSQSVGASSSVPLPNLEAGLPQQPLSPADSQGDSFALRVLSEPFSESEGEGTSINVVVKQAGPSQLEPHKVRNESFEASIRGRIESLQKENSRFLPQDVRGEYWEGVRTSLTQETKQQEYLRLLDFENRDLQIREQKHKCFKLVENILLKNPDLKPIIKPDEAVYDFFSEAEKSLAAERGGFPLNDHQLSQFTLKVETDLRERGRDSSYFDKIMCFESDD